MNTHIVVAQIEALRRAEPTVFEDEDASFISDVLEGETDFHAVMLRLLEAEAQAVADEAAIATRIKQLSDRKARVQQRQERSRDAMMALMTAAGLRKHATAFGTVSITPKRPSVVITDASRLPARCTRTKVEPDKSVIMECIKAGEDVPGAELSNGGETLTIRR